MTNEETSSRAERVGAVLDAALVVMGAIAVSAGAWMIYAPSGCIVGGVLAMALGLKRIA